MPSVEDYIRIAGDFNEFLKLCKINDAEKNCTIEFEFWPHLVELVDVFKRERLVIVLKSKQIGISYILAFYALWKALANPGFNCLVLSAGQIPAARLLDKCKFAYLNLPEWFRTVVPREKWSETEITFPTLSSRITALPSTETPGVGETSSLVIIDEWDFHPYPESDWATAEATASGGGQIIGVSTILKSKPNSKFKQLYRQAMQGENNFYKMFLPWNVRPDRDDKWLEDRKLSYLDEPWRVAENYPSTEEEALSALGGRSFFDTKTLERLLAQSRDPIETQQGMVHVYQKFEPMLSYAAGADISGQGEDYQALWILQRRGLTAEESLVIHSNQILPDTFAYISSQECVKYNSPLLAGEANAVGLTYLLKLQEYNYRSIFFRDKERTKIGWYTDENTRERMLYDLAEALQKGQLIIRYKPAILEMFDFQWVEVRGKNRIKSVGKHDDLVMALAIAYQMMKKAPTPITTPIPSIVQERRTIGMYSQ